jgi:hypothetical protein
MKTALAAALLCACAAGQAQVRTVWRCGPDGSSYSDSGCADGRPVAVAVDPRPAGDVAVARSAAARDRALALALVAERHEREHEWRSHGSGLTGIKPAPAPELRLARRTAKGTLRRPAADGTWRAAAPASR